MKRFRIIVAALAVLGCWMLGESAVVTARWMTVQVQTAQLRQTPSFLGKVPASLPYGEQVETLEEKSGWMRVRAATGAEGWTHASALSKKKIILKPGEADLKAAASNDELALAGKGFNASVEKEFRDKHRDVDFGWVDRMQGMKVSPEEIAKFLAEGGLAGGAK